MTLRPLPAFGPTLVDLHGIPRFWGTVWSTYERGAVAASTLAVKLGHLDAFYVHTEATHGLESLDRAIGELDIGLLGEMLESFFLTLKNAETVTAYSEARWQIALAFVRTMSAHIGGAARADASDARMAKIDRRLKKLDQLYSQLRIQRHSVSQAVRSLPERVLAELYDHANPTSSSNPFEDEATRWRYWTAFILLLHQGLRRGELLGLPADAVLSETHMGKTVYWMNVKSTEYEDDTRRTKPSIKTAASIRQIPVSPTTAKLVQAYTDNFRGKPSHSFLLSSERGRPLSAEGLAKAMRKLALQLSPSAKKLLLDKNGRETITPHDFRHTCAVVRLNQLLQRGDEMAEALQKMRSFFGWSPKSDMPTRYAKAVFDNRLATVWSDQFDDRVAILRTLDSAT